MQKPELLVLVAIWDFLVALVALIGICAISVLAFPPIIGQAYGPALVGLVFGLSVIMLIFVAILVVSLLGGIGLLRSKEWGRVMSLVNAAFSLFYFPVGTAIGVLAIIYLTRTDVRGYFNPVAR